MKALFVIAVIIASAHAKAATREEHPIDWYDCSEKADGNYVHPTDCTRFISCSGGIASQRDCAACNIEPRRCPEGRLVYNSTVDACLWADETGCGGDPDPNPNPLPGEGDPCNPQECKNEGYCQSYLRCDKNTARLVREECGENLVWNPQNPNGTNQIHGGNCDIWENLSDEIENKYRADPDCLGCFWRARGDCNREYDYQPPKGTNRNILRLSCAAGLVFSQEKETCQRCQDVRRKDGQTCC